MNVNLEKQIKEQMHKAFWDLIREDLNAVPQKFDHLIILIKEIKDKLKGLTPHRFDLLSEIDESLDESFLKHIFENTALEPEHFFNLIKFIIKKIKQYSSPYMDSELIRWEEEILKSLQQETIIYGEFISVFFENVNKYIDVIYTDVAKIKDNIKK